MSERCTLSRGCGVETDMVDPTFQVDSVAPSHGGAGLKLQDHTRRAGGLQCCTLSRGCGVETDNSFLNHLYVNVAPSHGGAGLKLDAGATGATFDGCTLSRGCGVETACTIFTQSWSRSCTLSRGCGVETSEKRVLTI